MNDQLLAAGDSALQHMSSLASRGPGSGPTAAKSRAGPGETQLYI